MNTGFADAEFCANILRKVLLKKESELNLFKKYEYYRKKAAKIATKRAYISMRIGTLKGFLFSGIRNLFIYILLPVFKKKIPYYFSMLSIPYGTYDKVKEKEKLIFK